MDSKYQDMAERSFGYGRWDARCYFLGPEQGMSKNEQELETRYTAWRHFGSRELDDCPEFHRFINVYKWHGKTGLLSEHPRPRLQHTWSKLIATARSFMDAQYERQKRLSYQIGAWGTLTGETCVIELSGIAANSTKVARDSNTFLEERIDRIRKSIAQHKPQFVLLYGKGRNGCCKIAWDRLTLEAQELPGKEPSLAKIRRLGNTFIAWAPHPVSHGPRVQDWENLGTRLRDLCSK